MTAPQNNDALLQVVHSRMESMHEDMGEMRDAIKGLTDAVTRLALIEERQATAAAAQERGFQAIKGVQDDVKSIDGRVTQLEIAQPQQKQVQQWIYEGLKAMAVLAGLFVAKKAGLI